MRITICGGGAVGHVTSGVLGCKKSVSLNMLTRHPWQWNSTVDVRDPNGNIFVGKFSKISADPAEVIPDSEVVYLCVPGYLIPATLKMIAPYLSSSTKVGACVSSSGFFFSAEKILPERTPLFGFQRVPYIARVVKYGEIANLLGYKKELKLAVKNIPDSVQFCNILENLFQTKITLLNSYYDAVLTNSNPILHPSRLYGMWHDWKPGMVYPRHILFYEDWDEFSAQVLIDCDKDFFNVIRHYPCTPGSIPTLLDYYESENATGLMKKLRSIPAFKKIRAPMISCENGYVPDWGNRYFEEDIPFGLQIIKDLADKVNEPVQTISKVLDWGHRMPIPAIQF